MPINVKQNPVILKSLLKKSRSWKKKLTVAYLPRKSTDLSHSSPTFTVWGSTEFSCPCCIYYREVASVIQEENKTRTSSSAWFSWKKEYNPWWVYKPCTKLPVFPRGLDWTAVEYSLQLPILHLWVSLKFPLSWKDYYRRNKWSNPLYPSSYKPLYLSPTCSTTKCQKNYYEKPQGLETINKKKKKINQEMGKKWKGICQALHFQICWQQRETTLGKGLGETSPPLNLFHPT